MPEKIKFYSDENVSKAVTNGLLLRRISILTANAAEMLHASDEEQLAFARKENRVLITQDSDFLRMHASGINHCGIVYAHQDSSIGNFIRLLVLVHEILTPNDMRNHLEFL